MLRAESVSTPSHWRARFHTDSNLRAGNRCSTWALSPEPPKRVWLWPPTRLRCCGEEERASILRLCIHVHTREYLFAKLSLRWTLCHPTPALTHSSCHPTRLCRGDPSGASLSCAPQCLCVAPYANTTKSAAHGKCVKAIRSVACRHHAANVQGIRAALAWPRSNCKSASETACSHQTVFL